MGCGCMIVWSALSGGYVDLTNTPPLRDNCQHLGETLRLINADCCGGRTRLKILACSIHCECSLAAVPDVADCLTCPDYLPPSPSGTILIPE